MMIDNMATGDKKTRTRKKQVLVPLNDKQLRRAEQVVPYQMTKAFSKLEKAQSVLNGRRTVTAVEPILTTLHTLLLNYSDMKSRIEKLKIVVSDYAYSERASAMQFLL